MKKTAIRLGVAAILAIMSLFVIGMIADVLYHPGGASWRKVVSFLFAIGVSWVSVETYMAIDKRLGRIK